MFAIENKNNKQKINEPKLKMKKTKLCQSALYSFFCVILRFFPWKTPESQICVFPWKKMKKRQQRNKKETKRCKLRRVLTKRKQNTNMQSTLSQLVSFLFVLGKNADFRFRSLQRKRNKKNTIQSTLAQFLSYLFFPFRMFLWFVFLVCFLVV